MLFGALIAPALLTRLTFADYAFALFVLFIARPLAMVVALIGADVTGREKLTVGWFGPRGFASVFFAFLIAASGIPNAERVFELLALVVAISVVLHSSTDVAVARWFQLSPGRQQA